MTPPRISTAQRRALTASAIVCGLTVLLALLVAAQAGVAPGY